MIGLNLGHWYLLKLAASKCPNSRKSSFRTWGQGDLLSAITDWQIFWGWLVNFESNLYRLLRPKILKNAKIKAFDTWKRHIRADFSKIRNCQIPPFARFLCQIVHRAAPCWMNVRGNVVLFVKNQLLLSICHQVDWSGMPNKLLIGQILPPPLLLS